MNQIYAKENFIIVKMDVGYIIINKDKDFKFGHTHIRNFKTAKYLIDMVIHQKIPYHLPIYLLKSLQRLSADDFYISKIQELIDNKQEHTQQYVNSR